ncbi:MAG: hypothetical protein K6G83_08290 [Lachnospiraceae bacterium]|nr:hypothetical protein [Lachnospiraceae bacterium]
MCRGNLQDGATQKQQTFTTEKNTILTGQPERDAETLRSVTAPIPVVNVPVTQQRDRYERVRQIEIKSLPELKIPERTLYDEYVTYHKVPGQWEQVAVNPQKTEYAERYQEQKISENKRAKKAENKKSRLYRKAENARQIEGANITERERELRLLRKTSKDMDIRLKEEDTIMLSKLMIGEPNHDKALLEKYAGDKTAKEELLLKLLEEFLQLDLSVYDLSNEEAIAGNAQSFESLNARVEGLLTLERKHPAFFNAVPQTVKDSFKIQKKNALLVVSYYRITKMIVTDPYYRTHYNSEVSRQWSPTDPPEKQRLTRLLWMRTELATHEINGKSWKPLPINIDLKDDSEVEKEHKKYEDIYRGVVSRDGEFAKSADYEDTSNPHYEFFRTIEKDSQDIEEGKVSKDSKDYEEKKKNAELHQKITDPFPQIAGTDLQMNESLGRTTTRMLEALRGIRNLSHDKLVQMLTDIYATPKENATPEEIKQVKQQNLAGLKVYKQLVAEQITYIDHKYPFFYEFAAPEEITKHKDNIQDDLCSIQVMNAFMRMIIQVPELFDPEDANDRYIQNALKAITCIQAAERRPGTVFDARGGAAAETLVGNRMGNAVNTIMNGINEADYGVIHLLEKLEKDSLEIKWDEVPAYKPLTAEEPVPVSETIEKLERRTTHERRSEESAKAARTLKDQNFSVRSNPPKTSELMQQVRLHYFEIDRKLKETIPEDEEDFNETVAGIEENYTDLIQACATYEEKRSPWTVLGKERKENVRKIRENAIQEKNIFLRNARAYFDGGKGGTFGDVIGDFQRTD